MLAVGIFANGTYGDLSGLVDGNVEQILAQLISAGTVVVWALSTGLALFWAIKRFMGLRASRDEEMEGLDGPDHSVPAYPEFPVSREAMAMGDAGDGD
jgi:Amt family ammonium transporter